MNSPVLSRQNPSASVGLAPMEGVTDFAVRCWFALTAPPDFTWTPFLRVTSTYPEKVPQHFIPEAFELSDLWSTPTIPQLMASDVDSFCRTAETLLNHVSFVDLNCGCPSPTVVGSCGGSKLLENPNNFRNFVEAALRRLGPERVSVKMRTGFHHPDELPELIEAVSDLKLAQLTIHGRTRPQRYTGQADWKLITKAASAVSFPVIGSGDLQTPEEFTAKSHNSSVHAAIIGRGALRNPWTFGSYRFVPIVEPLVAFALLQHASLVDKSRLMVFAKEGFLAQAAGANPDVWRKLIDYLLVLNQLSASSVSEINVEARAFARLKMLWNYLRSSLPSAFMDPELMRCKNLPAFVMCLAQIAIGHRVNLESVELQYRPELDWLYSGQGKASTA